MKAQLMEEPISAHYFLWTSYEAMRNTMIVSPVKSLVASIFERSDSQKNFDKFL